MDWWNSCYFELELQILSLNPIDLLGQIKEKKSKERCPKNRPNECAGDEGDCASCYTNGRICEDGNEKCVPYSYYCKINSMYSHYVNINIIAKIDYNNPKKF